MTRIWILMFILSIATVSVNALEIIDYRGISKQFDNADLYKLDRQELKTSREKDGIVRLNNWQGFRFDLWLKRQSFGEYNNIRFESDDRYLVSLSRAEFEAIESWIVVAQDGVPFEDNSLRLIFPSLREMLWISNLKRIVLENFVPMPRPTKFMLMKTFLATQKLQTELKPFVDIEGYYFRDFLPAMSKTDTHKVILCSRDDLKQNLDFPFHLEGAVLEKTKDGTYNLKSPQIPGGMWVKDITYLQCDDTAIIEQGCINSLINMHKLLSWEVSPELEFTIHKADEVLRIGFADALAEPQVFEGALYFELN